MIRQIFILIAAIAAAPFMLFGGARLLTALHVGQLLHWYFMWVAGLFGH